mgnify:CR=1 FL=1
MAPDRLKFHATPDMTGARMVLGFSGWMNGGEVSTGTVEALIERLGARHLAEVDSEDFYILNFPGSMEVSSLFRPYVKIEQGLVTTYRGPTNAFFFHAPSRLVLFIGKEPNLRWSEYAECIFTVASRLDVSTIYFVGSVAGLVPHTREPRMYGSVSDARLRGELQQLGVRLSNYEGPASLVTYLTHLAGQRGTDMVSLIAEIPAYVQGKNPRCIESMTRRLAGMLSLPINLDDLRALGDELERRLNAIVQQKPELAQRVRKLEEDYDSEVFDTQMGDLKDWLQQQGIRLD